MAHTTILNIRDVPSVRWKNGGGSTKEIAAFPPNAGLNDFVWRVSVAEIIQTSAYSIFPGVDRTQVLISGARLNLRNQTGLNKQLLVFEPFLFAGELDLLSEPEGVCQMLNVMTSRGKAESVLEVVHGDFYCVGDDKHKVLAVVQGEYIAEDHSQRFVLGDFVQAQLAHGEVLSLSASPDAVIVSIQISFTKQ